MALEMQWTFSNNEQKSTIHRQTDSKHTHIRRIYEHEHGSFAERQQSQLQWRTERFFGSFRSSAYFYSFYGFFWHIPYSVRFNSPKRSFVRSLESKYHWTSAVNMFSSRPFKHIKRNEANENRSLSQWTPMAVISKVALSKLKLKMFHAKIRS